jgi:hypothetical protein
MWDRAATPPFRDAAACFGDETNEPWVARDGMAFRAHGLAREKTPVSRSRVLDALSDDPKSAPPFIICILPIIDKSSAGLEYRAAIDDVLRVSASVGLCTFRGQTLGPHPARSQNNMHKMVSYCFWRALPIIMHAYIVVFKSESCLRRHFTKGTAW